VFKLESITLPFPPSFTEKTEPSPFTWQTWGSLPSPFLLQATGYLSLHFSFARTIEVSKDGNLEKIFFPIPKICNFLTSETRQDVELNTEKNEQGSKIPAFYNRMDDLYFEMVLSLSFFFFFLFLSFLSFLSFELLTWTQIHILQLWQHELESRPTIYWFAKRISLWNSISFNLTIWINLLMIFTYPFDSSTSFFSFLSPLVLYFLEFFQLVNAGINLFSYLGLLFILWPWNC